MFFYEFTTSYIILVIVFLLLSNALQGRETPDNDQVERSDSVMETNASPLPEFVHDELIEDNASLTGNRDDDLLFPQLPLPDQLLQSDEKDGDDDSNSVNDIHRNGIIQNQDSIKLEDGQELQDQNKVSTNFSLAKYSPLFALAKNENLNCSMNLNRNLKHFFSSFAIFRRKVNTNRHYHQKIMECCPVSIRWIVRM